MVKSDFYTVLTDVLGPIKSLQPEILKVADVINVVFQTTDYALFQTLDANREVNRAHVKQLVASFEAQFLECPILVNEHMEVIDGQHRLAASIEAHRPVHFTMVRGYGLEEVQRLNTNNKTWKKQDYLDSYAKLGVEAYVQMKAFMAEYPKLGFGCVETLLTQNSKGANNKGSDATGAAMRNFEMGSFEIVDLAYARRIADYLMRVEPLYDGFARRWFVQAIVTLVRKESFDMAQFLGKLRHQLGVWGHRNSVTEYIALIEEVYNWRRKEGDRVNLRF